MKIDQDLVEANIRDFFGYGNPQAKWWFVGMEEHGGATVEESRMRLNAWRGLGGKALVDLKSFHKAARLNLPHLNTPVNWRKGCSAWKRQIHVLLAAQGLPCDDQHMIERFADWGAHDSNTCLIELKPLPCPNWRSWPWPQWCHVEDSKTKFLTRIQTDRCQRIMDMIKASPVPRCVVFYSTGRTFLSLWETIASCAFDPVVAPGIYGKKIAGTVFVAIPQRRKGGISYTLMTQVGSWLKDQLSKVSTG